MPGRRWCRPDEDRRRPEAFDFQPQFGKLADNRFQPVAFQFVQLDHVGHQEGLTGDLAAVRCFSHPLQHQPFVRGMLVDDDQPVVGLGHDIGRGDLAAGDAERI